MKKTKLLVLCYLCFSFIAEAQCWKSVSVGFSHNLAIANNGTLWAWGRNTKRELGIGSTADFISTPTQVGTDNNWKEVSAGNDGIYTFNLAIKNNGTLWAWGYNNNGQLGDGTSDQRTIPVQIGTDTDWKTVSAGLSHSVAIKNNGTLWTWGESNHYALGSGPSGPPCYVPTQRGTDTNWSAISADDLVTVAIKSDGTVWGWGDNNGNMLNISSADVTVPTQRSYNATNVRRTSAGGAFSYDVKTSNLLVPWSSLNTLGVTGGTNCSGCPSYYVKEMDCGDATGVIIKTDGTLWYTGVTMGGAGNSEHVSAFTQLGTANNWKSVSVGDQSAAVIDNNGGLWTWGWNFWGMLGNGTSGSQADSRTLVGIQCPASLAINDYEETPVLIVYPNPVKNILSLQLSQDISIQKIMLTDISGKIIIIHENANPDIDVTALTSGVYFIRVHTDKGEIKSKFIKE